MNRVRQLSYGIAILFLNFLLCASSYGITLVSEQQKEEEKIVYLTFDDGPTTGVTESILDVLKEKEVKATFFVVGKEIIEREDVLKRIYEEGHTIGLHTYTHNFKKVYSSSEAFIEEMKATSDKVNEVLGTAINFQIIRFPGGSAGRLTKPFLEALHAEHYKIYDWNVNLEDGVNPGLDASTLVRNARNCSRNTNVRIILAHCNKNNLQTPKALPYIIDYYKKEGYVFKAIDEDTPEFYYTIKSK